MPEQCCNQERSPNTESSEGNSTKHVDVAQQRYNDCCRPSTAACCGTGASEQRSNQHTLKIEWQRVIANDETCPRCGSTEIELDKAVHTLMQSLAPLGIDVIVEKKALSVAEFKNAPLQSNRIWINSHPLEEYMGGRVGQSPCCDVCGPAECRTVEITGQVYETIPSEVIIKAGLIAATQLVS